MLHCPYIAAVDVHRTPPGSIAFDIANSQYSELAPVRITSLSHGAQNLGELAADLMLRQLRGETCQSVVVPWVLAEKESS